MSMYDTLFASIRSKFTFGTIIFLSLISLPAFPIFADDPWHVYLPVVTQQVAPTKGIWISKDELSRLPTSGSAWDWLKAAADQDTGLPTLSDQESNANVLILAKALVYARTGERHYQNEVVAALRIITFNNTEDGGRTLALGRKLAGYVIAADLINLADYDATFDEQFRQKLRELLTKPLDNGQTLQSTHEKRPNNWGTHAGASRAAVAVYLGDAVELERTATVFHGWLGDRSAYSGFKFVDDISWMADPANPVSLNPVGSVKDGHSIDGALTEEMVRGGPFQWPPIKTTYAWQGLQGALVQAEILHRAGYPTWEWEDRALLRAAQFLYDIGWGPDLKSSDVWMIGLINHAYHTSFPTNPQARSGVNMGWTGWTHNAP